MERLLRRSAAGISIAGFAIMCWVAALSRTSAVGLELGIVVYAFGLGLFILGGSAAGLAADSTNRRAESMTAAGRNR